MSPLLRTRAITSSSDTAFSVSVDAEENAGPARRVAHRYCGSPLRRSGTSPVRRLRSGRILNFPPRAARREEFDFADVSIPWRVTRGRLGGGRPHHGLLQSRVRAPLQIPADESASRDRPSPARLLPAASAVLAPACIDSRIGNPGAPGHVR